MCLILFAWHAHPEYPLIFAGNRDEAYDRPSAAADFWSDAPGIYGGRDLEKGGTWLGLALSGRFAAVTNYRDGPPRKPADLSRGDLASGFLRGADTPEDYLRSVAPNGDRYGGYSLLVGNLDRLYYLSNRGPGIADIAPGTHGLSNHLLDTPWPKIRLGKQRLAALLEAGEAKLVDGLFDALADRTPAPDSELPDSGIGLQRERELSPAFIAGERYGTRASTVVLISRCNEVTHIERHFGPLGQVLEPETRRRFAIQVRAKGRKTNSAGQDV
jgi:uncharacterized protein with NRDE domain